MSGGGSLRLAAVLLGLCTSAGCAQDSFTCSDASDCVISGFEGMCVGGHCAFPDEACASGWKYGDLAPSGVAGTCAEGVGGTSSGVGGSSSSLGTTSTTTAPSEEAGATSSSTSPIDPTTAQTDSSSGEPVGESSSSSGNGSQVTEVWGDTPDSDHPGTVDDTWININTENHVTSAELRVYTWPSQMISNVILMQWDVSALQGVQVQSATIVLHVLGKEGMPEQQSLALPLQGVIGVHPNLSEATGLQYAQNASWTPNLCCYNDIPMAQADLGPIVDLVEVEIDASEVQWDVTELVRGWVDSPNNNHGLAISGDENAGADADRIFASSEYPDPALRPRLVVTYVAR